MNEVAEGKFGEVDDELLRRLREWAASRERHHLEKEGKEAMISVDVDSKHLSSLIPRLLQLEKSLKYLRLIRKSAGTYKSRTGAKKHKTRDTILRRGSIAT